MLFRSATAAVLMEQPTVYTAGRGATAAVLMEQPTVYTAGRGATAAVLMEQHTLPPSLFPHNSVFRVIKNRYTFVMHSFTVHCFLYS